MNLYLRTLSIHVYIYICHAYVHRIGGHCVTIPHMCRYTYMERQREEQQKDNYFDHPTPQLTNVEITLSFSGEEARRATPHQGWQNNMRPVCTATSTRIKAGAAECSSDGGWPAFAIMHSKSALRPGLILTGLLQRPPCPLCPASASRLFSHLENKTRHKLTSLGKGCRMLSFRRQGHTIHSRSGVLSHPPLLPIRIFSGLGLGLLALA